MNDPVGIMAREPSPFLPRMNFGAALSCLRKGERVAREGWNGKGMYLFLVENWACITETKDEDYPHLPFIAMKTADDHVVPWLASQTDILAGDWSMLPEDPTDGA